MRWEREKPAGGPIVAGFSAGGFRVAEQVYRALLLTVDEARAWTPPPLADLALADVETVLTPSPEFLLLGTGATLARPPRAFTDALRERGLGVEFMDSRAAARAWGVLRGEGRRIAAALYPLG